MRRSSLQKQKRSPGAPWLIVMAMMLGGCPDERATSEASEPAQEAVSSNVRAPLVAMEIDVARVQADGAVDQEAVKAALREAEPALKSCLDPDGSTGVFACRVSVSDNGAVGAVSQLKETTYGSDDARACFERIIASLRFPTEESRKRLEITATLEVRTRYESMP